MAHLMHAPGRILVAYAVYVFAAGLLFYLVLKLVRGDSKGLRALTAYMAALVGVGGLRFYWASRFGANSARYATYYWVSDFALVLSAFLLICYFFRRASLGGAPRLWPHIRLLLTTVFLLTGAVALFVVFHHRARFFPFFVIEFQQDLYFVCMVLTTMLYLMMLQYSPEDQQLGLLACGLGIEYAGLAASLALVHLAGASPASQLLQGYLTPLADMGMFLTWFYVAVRVPYRVAARETRRAPRPVRVGQLVEIS